MPHTEYMKFENVTHSYKLFLSIAPPQLQDKAYSQW